MSNTMLAFAGTKGLDITADPIRSQANENGVVTLSSCDNVDVDKTGAVRTRDGFVGLVTTEGKIHSLFDYPEQGGLLCVVDDALAIVSYAGDSISRLRNVDKNLRMRFARAKDNKVYYSNSKEGGKILERTSYPFSFSETLPFSTKHYDTPPIDDAETLCIHQARLFVSVGNTVYYSEAFAHEAFALGTNLFQLPDHVLCLQGIDPGSLFVGTENGGYFIKGTVGNDEAIMKVFEGRCLEVVMPKNVSMHVGNQEIQNAFFVLGSFGVRLVSPHDGSWHNVFSGEGDFLMEAKSAFGAHIKGRRKFIFGWR